MKRFSKLIGFIVVFMVMMVTICTVSFAATVGQRLASPERGWQRIDDNDSRIIYSSNLDLYKGSQYYQNTNHFTQGNSSSWAPEKGYVKIKYYGTKIRLLGGAYNSNFGSHTVAIDDLPAEKVYRPNGRTDKSLIIWYEKANLPLGVHTLYIDIKDDGLFGLDALDIDDTGYLIDYKQPTNLIATAGNEKADLKWDCAEGATSYNIKRATTSGGTYTTIATSSAITFIDTNVKNGIPYYYVVSAVNSNGESLNSNEVSATPEAIKQLKLVLEVNEGKQLSVSEELSNNTELDWTSLDSKIATVDANGKVKGLKAGNTIITCTSEDKSYAESINVLVVDLQYQLAVDLNAGEKCRLTVDDLANATNVTWTAYDSTIATVTSKGKVTAISDGLTYVVASDKDGREIGTIYIRVRK